ncbi:hypothetical protein CRG98_027579 [Punica granatum]|uniref:Reverse transcriptase domain-containing protein n=1 Tax=Punica granatum TaxID=22663 RepID=A0A2I0J703_PUNGR|nr:hypothetical protein CRG98_027579 [Punica granatum]
MPGLDPSIVKHFLPLDTEKFPPKRQQLRRQRASLLLRIKEEVFKQINADFLEVCNYSKWVANIVPVEKKDGRVRVCVDYRDLNKASPKDNFPMPHINVLVDNTARHAQFSFMDGFSGYNQIRMVDVSTPFWLTIPNNDISNDPSHDLSRIQKTARQSKKSLFILKLAKLSK